jgi:NodT family efflux transporter outer membrane factor (OMF) lipoprotein
MMRPITERLLLAACVTGLALAGCNLAPHYERPPTDSTGGFKEAVPNTSTDPQGWKLAEPNDSLLRGNWWELYHDTQLNELEERVAISNQTIAAAEANYRVARAMVGEAQASLFPTVSVAPSVIRSRSSASNSSGGSSASFASTGGTTTSGASTGGSSSSTGVATVSGGSTVPKTDYTLPFEASYELDLWGSVRNSVAQSRYNAEASAANVQTAILSTQSTLAQDYFALRATDEERRILDTTLGDYEASLHLVRTLYNNGLASEEDMAEADTQLDSAEAQATDLGVARAQYEHAIAVLIGVPPSRFSIGFSRFNATLPVIPVSVPSDLLERRPDIAAAERQVAAANAGIGIARAAYFPNLTINASAGFESNTLGTLLDWPNRMWSLGPTLVQPLFDGGLRRAENAQARAQYDATVANYRQAVLTAFQSVEDNLVSLRVLSKEVDQLHKAALAGQNTVKLSVIRYQNGVDSYVNVITAQNTFLTNRLAELQVQLRQLTATIALVNNVGGGWDKSQLSDTEKRALHPGNTAEKAEVPAENAGPGVPNPPPLPATIKRPEDILKQNEEDMAPGSASGSQGGAPRT